jgi:hypothetical protein
MSQDHRGSTSATVLLVAGLLCVVIGLAWRWIIPSSVVWSDAQAESYSQAYDAAHTASIGHRHDANGHDHAHSAESEHGEPSLEEARKRFAEMEAKLSRAQTFHNNAGRVLAAIGAILLLAGLAANRGHQQ